MNDASPSNSEIKKSLGLLFPELLKRYGRSVGCTLAQLTTTAKDLAVASDVFPYLCAVFLSKEDLLSQQGAMISVRWDEVVKRGERIMNELIGTRKPGDGFRESGIGPSAATILDSHSP